MKIFKLLFVFGLLFLSLAIVAEFQGSSIFAPNSTAEAVHLTGSPATYTLDADFDEGTLINVNHDTPNNDQLQINETTEAFNFIWVAASTRGTVVKIDTQTGAVLGEYLSSPDGRGRSPSRTTVDANGNVWTGNRAEATGGQGSVVRIGLEENGQCQDRDGSGVIDTSTGLGDIRPWLNPGGIDDGGGVSSAEDECIINYVRVAGDNIRHVSVDANNNVWTAGNFGSDNAFDLVDGNTAAILASFDVGCGGYGGLVDGNGVIWSANRGPGPTGLLRYDTKGTLTTADDTSACLSSPNTYGLGIDSNGNIWNSQWTSNSIMKFDPAGNLFAGFPKTTFGASNDRGVAVTPDDHVWVANSAGSDVSRLDNLGNLIAVIPVGVTPTGVAVDGAGNVWATSLTSSTASRIDPSSNTVDLTVDLNAVLGLGLNAGPYNYSDMTGSIVPASPTAGTWTIVHDTGVDGAEWGTVSWTSDEPSDSSITVMAASSNDGVTFGPGQAVTDGADLTVGDGRYLKVSVSFTRASTNESPVLFDLTITAFLNDPPDCTNATPSIGTIWPPNHKFVAVGIMGVTDPDSDPITITVDSIWQDEPVDTTGDGSFTPDGMGIGTDTAHVRAERTGSKKVPGNGRVYHIGFTADDGQGGACSGEVLVGVPHDRGRGSVPIDGGALHDSTVP